MASSTYKPIDKALFKKEPIESVASWLKQVVEAAQGGLSDVRSMILNDRQQYDGLMYGISTEFDGNEEDQMRFFIPYTKAYTDTWAARAARVLLSPKPLFDVEVQRSADTEAASHLQDGIDYKFRAQIGIEPLLRDALTRAGKEGNVFTKDTYVREEGTTRSRQIVTPELRASMPEDRELQAVDSTGNYLIADGEEVEVESPPEIVIDQPEILIIPADKFLIYPSECNDIDTALAVGYEFEELPHSLIMGAQQGLYDMAAVKKLLESPSTAQMPEGDQDTDDAAGVSYSSAISQKDVPYQLAELVVSYDTGTEDEPFFEDILFVIELGTSTMLRGERFPLWMPPISGSRKERWYSSLCPFPRAGSLWGYSIPRIIADPQDYANLIYQQNAKAGALENTVIIIKKPGSKVDLMSQRFDVGTVYEAEPNDIQQLALTTNRQGARMDVKECADMIQLVLGINTTATGLVTGSSETTLGEVENALAEGNERAAYSYGYCHETMNRWCNHVIYHERQFGPLDQEFFDPDAPKGSQFKLLSQQDLNVKARIVARGNPELANPLLKIQRAEKLANYCASNPEIAGDPVLKYAVDREVIKALGYLNYTDIIGTMESAIQRKQAQMQGPPPLLGPATLKLDEITSLALTIQQKEPSMAQAPFDQLWQVALQYVKEQQQNVLPQPPGSRLGDAPDNGPGDSVPAATAPPTIKGAIV